MDTREQTGESVFEPTVATGPDGTLRERGGEPSAALSPGSTLGRYRLGRVVGHGGCGIVYEAVDATLDRRVALKLLLESSDDDVRRLRREAVALARLNHPNVTQVFEVGDDGGRTFVAMEFVDGESFRIWRRKNEPGTDELLRVLRAVGQALSAAHGHGLIHRDVKPDNILVGRDGEVKVVDFGLARLKDELEDGAALGPPSPHPALIDDDITRLGTVMGTPRYMSPEQHRGDALDPRSDQFSFCVTAFEALLGHSPFPADTFQGIYDAIKKGIDAPESANVPRSVLAAIHRGLSFRPDDRFADMQALLEALDTQTVRRRRSLIAAGAVATLAAGLGFWAGGAKDDPCEGARDRTELAAFDGRRAELERRAMGALAPDRAQWLVATLAERIATASDQRLEACTAHHRGEMTAAAYELRTSCVDQRLTYYTGLSEALAEGNDDTFQAALLNVAASKDQPCDDEATARRLALIPADPEQKREVEQARAVLARARSLHAVADYDAEIQALDGLAGAPGLDFAPLRAEYLGQRGLIAFRRRDMLEAETVLEQALWLALEVDHDTVAGRALPPLLLVRGVGRQRAEQALELRPLATMLSNRIDDDEQRLGLETTLTAVMSVQDMPAARARFGELLAEREALFGPDDYGNAPLHANLAKANNTTGRPGVAVVHATRAREIRAKALGKTHPNLFVPLINEAYARTGIDDIEGAQAAADWALEVAKSHRDADHVELAQARLLRAWLAIRQGIVDGRAEDIPAGLQRYSETYGTTHPRTCFARLAAGNLALLTGNHQEGIDALQPLLEVPTSKMKTCHIEAMSVLLANGVQAEQPELGMRAFNRGLAATSQLEPAQRPFYLAGLCAGMIQWQRRYGTPEGARAALRHGFSAADGDSPEAGARYLMLLRAYELADEPQADAACDALHAARLGWQFNVGHPDDRERAKSAQCP